MYWTGEDALLSLDGQSQDGEMHVLIAELLASIKIAIALIECIKAEHDQIEFVDLNGEPVYIYEEQDLEYFRRLGQIQNAALRGRTFLRVRVFEFGGAEDPVFSIWKSTEEWQAIHGHS
jgi:hypothetical protein